MGRAAAVGVLRRVHRRLQLTRRTGHDIQPYAWCQRTKQMFAGWTATHHAITNHRIAIDGDRATIRAHIRAEHWAPPEVAAGGPDCWLVVGFYDNVAVRTPEGWRLSVVKLTLTHQENEALLATSMAAVKGLTSPPTPPRRPGTPELPVRCALLSNEHSTAT